MSTLRDLIAQLDALEKEATPGPWCAQPNDLSFIVAFRNAYPRLREVLEAAVAFSEAWKDLEAAQLFPGAGKKDANANYWNAVSALVAAVSTEEPQ